MPRDSSTTLRFARNDISAVLLAGGESRRMGTDKAAIVFRGKPLWQIQLGLLRKLAPAEIFVSARADPAWRPAHARFVADEPPSRGPLSGLAASLHAMRGTHLLALAIDMPLMTEIFLRYLYENIDTARGVIPNTGDRYEPLVAIYPREVAADFDNALRGEDFSLQHIVRRLLESGKLREVRVKEHQTKLFLNVNEPVDVAAL